MDRLLNLKKVVGDYKPSDLKTPNEDLSSPFEHSTAIRENPTQTRKRSFFPSFSEHSPTETDSKTVADLVPNLNDMSSFMKDLSVVSFYFICLKEL